MTDAGSSFRLSRQQQHLWALEPVLIVLLAGPLFTLTLYQRSSLRSKIATRDANTDNLTGLLDPSRREEMLARNARLRIEGTPNLVAAAIAAGARRLIAQSIAFAYAEGAEPHAETDPLASPRRPMWWTR